MRHERTEQLARLAEIDYKLQTAQGVEPWFLELEGERRYIVDFVNREFEMTIPQRHELLVK